MLCFQVVKKIFDIVTSWPADIKVFGRTYLRICNAASDWPHTFITPRVFCLAYHYHTIL